MKNMLLAALLFTLALPLASAQKFWLTTYEFPGGPKTGLAGIRDSCLFAGLTHGVLRSFNEGKSWQQVLHSGQVFTVHATDDGHVFAGGQGKIYFSNDYGNHWDSAALNLPYPVVDIAHNVDNQVFAVTNDIDTVLGYVGGGVYFSGDHGVSWVQRNKGLNNQLSCDQVAVDRYGRVYVTAQDEYSDGLGGLFVSTDNGLQWQHLDIRIDGDGVIENEIGVTYTTGLEISDQDSLYLNVMGVAGSASVRLNLHKHLEDLFAQSLWQRYTIHEGPSWWLDYPLTGIHFARNGDRYSSVPGSLSKGGTYFKAKNAGWNQQLQGLGLDVFGNFSRQMFAEKSNGKIFMVQYFDERIYWADTSAVTGVHDGEWPDLAFQVAPNPVFESSSFRVSFEDDFEEKTVFLSDLYGRLVSSVTGRGAELEMRAPEQAGVYFIDCAGRRVLPKLLVVNALR